MLSDELADEAEVVFGDDAVSVARGWSMPPNATSERRGTQALTSKIFACLDGSLPRHNQIIQCRLLAANARSISAPRLTLIGKKGLRKCH